MIVTCEECKTSFNLDEELVKQEGSKVRCSKCKHIFVIFPPEPPLKAPIEDLKAIDTGPDLPPEAESPKESPDSGDAEKAAVIPETLSGMDEDRGVKGADSLEMENLFDGADDQVAIEWDLETDSDDEGAMDAERDSESLELDLDLALEGQDELEEELLDESADKGDHAQGVRLDLDTSRDEALDFSEPGIDTIEIESFPGQLELDLDLEDQLEADLEIPEVEMQGAEVESEDLELDLDLDLDTGKLADLESGATETETELAEIDSEEIELELDLDSEDVEGLELSDADISAELTESDSEDLEFDLDFEPDEEVETEVSRPAVKADSETAESEEFDLEFESEDNLEIKDDIEVDAVTENINLQFEIEEPEEEAAETVKREEEEVPAEAFGMALPAGVTIEKPQAFDFDAAEDYDEVSPDLEVRPKKKKRFALPLIILILVLLFGGAVGALVMLGGKEVRLPLIGGVTVPSVKGIDVSFLRDIEIPFVEKIPFVGDFFKPAVPDEGNLKIIITDSLGKFINNPKSGRLFLIRGSIKNDYKDARSFVIVTGKLYTKGKNFAKAETVFPGNVLSDLELTNLDYMEIKKRLKNRSGDNRSNENIKPGATLPFMIVFSDLPDNLEEYTIEIKGSSPAK